jgi:nucleotide-binding universal stress UspA family protein
MLNLKTILHPTNFSDRSQHALRLACELAEDYDAHLIVLHVANVPTAGFVEGVVIADPEEWNRIGREQLDRLELPHMSAPVDRWLEQGEPVAVILDVAQEAEADLIVMGTHGRTGVGRLLIGSVAEQVLRKAACPVLTVKTPSSRAASRSQRTATAVPA